MINTLLDKILKAATLDEAQGYASEIKRFLFENVNPIEVRVVSVRPGSGKIAIIKEIRTYLHENNLPYGLKEAKEMSENTIPIGTFTISEAIKLSERLTRLGARVSPTEIDIIKEIMK